MRAPKMTFSLSPLTMLGRLRNHRQLLLAASSLVAGEEQDALLAAAKRRAEEKRRVVGNAIPPSASVEETKERTNSSSASSSSSCDYNKMDWFNLLGVVTNPTSTSSYYDQCQYPFNNGGMGSMHGRRPNCTSGRGGVQVSSRYGTSISLDHVGSGDFDWIAANG